MTMITLIVLALTALAVLGICRDQGRTESRIEVMLATTPRCDRCGAFVCDGMCRCRRSTALARF
ncbi:MAG: hypothetical protein K1X95_09480 [Acidimicrobiia bacterium]|nr:hypothetical protein [Acidimicrobiia bacterium]